MRVLFQTVANRSHLHIAAPLAWALRSAGHDVLVASQSDIAEAIGDTGLQAVVVGPRRDREMTDQMNEADPSVPDATPAATASARGPSDQEHYAQDDPAGEWSALVEHLFPVMSPDEVIDDLVEVARAWRPDLVIWDMLTYGGPVAARACGAAHARLVLATDGVGQLRAAMHRSGALPGPDPLRDWLGPKLARYGQTFDEDVAVGDWTLDLMPDWTYHPRGLRTLPVRHVPFNGPATIPRWLLDKPDRRRVCVTLGNSHRDAGRVEASSVALLEALAGLDIEVVATLHRDQIGLTELPDNVRAVDFVPLGRLLPTCDAIVHHGGAGTFAGAVENGVPQVIVPSTWWSEKWYGPVAMGAGVARRGAGLYPADSDEITASVLRRAMLRVLDEPSFLENAAGLREENEALPRPSEAVPILERLVRRHRRR